MASITITIPDEQVDRILDAFVFDDTLTQSEKVEVVRTAIKNFIKSRVRQYERGQALELAIAAAAPPEEDVDLT